MKKRSIYLLFTILMFIVYTPVSLAATIRETLNSGDEYDTLEPNTFIIGVTKFSGNEVITASKASTAGANDAMLYVQKHGTVEGYKPPVIYYYIDSFVGWFAIDTDNNATPVTDTETLNKLSNLDIYYINNNEKLLEVPYNSGNIIPSTLTNGATYKDNKILVPATISKFEFQTVDGNKIGYIMDNTTSTFILDEANCYTVENGVITNYDGSCSSNVIIPTHINGEEIVGIEKNAFYNKNIKSIIIPSNIKYIKSNAFANNNLESVTIKEKYDESDFLIYGENVFGVFADITYDNDITRALNIIDDNIIINVYKEIDTNELKDNFLFFDQLLNQLIDKFMIENNYHSTGGSWPKYYEATSKDLFTIRIGWDQVNQKDKLIIEKYIEETDKVYEVSKDIEIIFNKTGTKKDNDSVLEAIKNIKIDNRDETLLEDSQKYNKIPTRSQYLEDIEDNYNLEIIKTVPGYGIDLSEEEISHGEVPYYCYIFKDNILYQTSDIMMIGEINYYNAMIYPEDYPKLNKFIAELLNVFEVRTGVNNYEILYNEDGSLYEKELKGSGYNYYIKVRDKEYNEIWIITFFEAFKDNYDEYGNTKAECFTFSDGVIYAYDGTCGSNVVIPNTINGQSVTEIAGRDYDKKTSFYSLELRSVILPDTLIKIGEDAFEYNDLTSIIIPDSVTEIGNWAFSNNDIESVKLSKNLDKISMHLFHSNKIKEIEIPDSIISIENYAFYNNEIERLEIPSSVISIGDSAFEKNKISSLIIPNTIQEIGEAAFNNNQLSDEDAFIYERMYDHETNTYKINKEKVISYAGTNRNNINIPSTVKKIGDSAFSNLHINNIEIPYGITEIGDNAFNYNNITSISVPNTVTYIGNSAFSSNPLKTINLNEGLESIGRSSFYHYNSNQKIIIPSTVKTVGYSAFGEKLSSVEIRGKSSLDEFDSLGENPFGIVEGFTNVTFTN